MAAALLSPRMLVLHAIGLVGVVGTAWLGAWQVGAWQENREDKAAALVNAAAIPLDQALGPDTTFPSKYVGQPVTLSGTWLADDTVYVEREQGGYWVVTPVSTETGSAIPVVRGSSAEPRAESPTGDTTVTGWLQPGESASTPDADPADDVLPRLRIADILERMDQDLYGGYVIAKEPREAALQPVTPDQLPKPGMFTSIRNLLYGVEWWVFGLFALFLWWRWCKDEVERVRSGTVAADDDEDADSTEIASTA